MNSDHHHDQQFLPAVGFLPLPTDRNLAGGANASRLFRFQFERAALAGVGDIPAPCAASGEQGAWYRAQRRELRPGLARSHSPSDSLPPGSGNRRSSAGAEQRGDFTGPVGGRHPFPAPALNSATRAQSASSREPESGGGHLFNNVRRRPEGGVGGTNNLRTHSSRRLSLIPKLSRAPACKQSPSGSLQPFAVQHGAKGFQDVEKTRVACD